MDTAPGQHTENALRLLRRGDVRGPAMMAAWHVGIDLGGTKIEGLALDKGVEQARVRVATPRDDYAGTLDAIVNIVSGLVPGGQAATVGVGIPGSIEPSTGLVKNANSTWLIGRPLKQDLEARLARPVAIANDANCFALSEATDGAGRGAAVVFGVIVGTGVGGGLVVDGRCLTGPNGVAGEWGHTPLPWMGADEFPGALCYCGRRGCIETFLSGPALAAEYTRHTRRVTTAEELVARAESGELVALEHLARYEHRAARALAGLVNVIDPDVIVLGGGVSNVARLYESIPRLWSEFVFACAAPSGGEAPGAPRLPVRTALRRAAHGDASGVRGAAWLGAAGLAFHG